MTPTFITYKEKQICFYIRPEYLDRDKCIDVQIIKEIFTQNVYKLATDNFSGPGIMVDIGANIGTVGIQAAMLGAKRVISIEPNKSNLESLKANFLENNVKTEIIEKAVTSKEGTAKITDEAGNSKVGDEGDDIETTTLENIVSEISEDIDVLKMDIEGGEYEALLATPIEVLAKIKYITMEFHATTKENFGNLICHLSKQFVVETIGAYNKGGQIIGKRY